MLTKTDELLAERDKTHGSWERQAQLAQSLKMTIDVAQLPVRTLSKGQREAIDMICVKLSRIVCGNPNEPDHWLDISGYATLGQRSQGL